MLFLDATTKSLEVLLGGAVSASQLPFVAGYADIERTTYGLSGAGENDGTTNDTTAVTLAAAPAATTTRKLNFLSIFNADSAAATVTVRVNNASTYRVVWQGTLSVGDTLMFVDGRGFYVTDQYGQIKSGGSTGIIPLAYGGTGAALTAVNGGIVWSNASTMAISAAGSSGQILRSGGPGAPTWSTATFPSTASTTGAYLRADGTNWIASTLVLPNSATAGDIFIATGANTQGSLAIGSAGKFLRSNGTAPTWATTTIPDTIAQYKLFYASAANTLTATNNLSWNETTLTVTGTLGVGTTAGKKLHVYASDLNVATFERDSTNGVPIEFKNTVASMFAGLSAAENWAVSTSSDLDTNAILTVERLNLRVGIGTITPSAKIHALATAEQLRLGYNASNYASFTISSGGDLTIAPSGGDTSVTGTLAASGRATFGGALSHSTGLKAVGDLTTGTTQYGVLMDNTLSGTTLTSGVASAGTVKAATTVTAWRAFEVVNPTDGGSGAAITTLYGLYVNNLTRGSTNYAISTGTGIVNFGDVVQIASGAIGLKVGGTVARGTTAGTNAIHVFNGTAPVGTLANGISLYSAAGEAWVMDAAGNATQISPHDPETNEWIYYSHKAGRHLKIRMERLCRWLDEQFGQSFVEEWLEAA